MTPSRTATPLYSPIRPAGRGSGDPSLTSEDFWRLAADLRNAGVRSVRDGLVIDDTVFDDPILEDVSDAVTNDAD